MVQFRTYIQVLGQNVGGLTPALLHANSPIESDHERICNDFGHLGICLTLH